MNRVLGLLFIASCVLFALIAYNALAVVHYDLDPVSVLAFLLNVPIPVLGYISMTLSLALLVVGIALLRSGDEG